VYAGHFAAALAIKAKQPLAPTWALLLGTGFLDVLFGVFVLCGIERVTMTPGMSPGFSLNFIDWSHSAAMALVWAVLYGLSFWRLRRTVILALAFAVFSHFLLDLPMHPPDLALWPYSSLHLGIGLWRRWPVGWWWVELAFIAAGYLYYVARARKERTFGGHALWACFVVVLLHIMNSPWLSPSR
jgi:hypothetical protein